MAKVLVVTTAQLARAFYKGKIPTIGDRARVLSVEWPAGGCSGNRLTADSRIPDYGRLHGVTQGQPAEGHLSSAGPLRSRRVRVAFLPSTNQSVKDILLAWRVRQWRRLRFRQVASELGARSLDRAVDRLLRCLEHVRHFARGEFQYVGQDLLVVLEQVTWNHTVAFWSKALGIHYTTCEAP
jgi:hypothetical protein